MIFSLRSQFIFLFIALLPAHLANGAPVLFTHLPVLNFLRQPIDQKKTFRGKRILGDHKTWLGLVAGGVAGLFGGAVLAITSYLPFNSFSIMGYGFVCGVLAIVGDSFKSLIKRQLNIGEGQPWIPYDQIDYLLFVLPFVSFWLNLSLTSFLLIIAQSFGLSIIVSSIGYKIGIKDRWF